MAKRWSVECSMCGKESSFADDRDISHAKWKVIAWIVPDGSPKVICDKCVLIVPKVRKPSIFKSDET